jgi:hypothetical protein
MRQNLVTFPAAAIRTSASLSRRRRTYAGTKSALLPIKRVSPLEKSWVNIVQKNLVHMFYYPTMYIKFRCLVTKTHNTS